MAWVGTLSRAMSMYATKAMATRAAGQAVEPVGQVHAVRRGDDGEGAEQDVQPRVDRHGADERARRWR